MKSKSASFRQDFQRFKPSPGISVKRQITINHFFDMNSQATSGPEARNQQEALQLTGQLKELVQSNDQLLSQKKNEAFQCLTGIEEKVRAGAAPDKVQFDDLMKAVGEEEEITTPALRLGEMYGYIPSL